MKNGRVIKGQIQSIGPYISNYIGDEYVHVIMVHDDGKIEQLKSVTVPSVVGAFFTPARKVSSTFTVTAREIHYLP